MKVQVKAIRPSQFTASPFLSVLIVLVSVSLCTVSPAQVRRADAGVNLAVVAKPSSSYVSGDTTLAALNDGNKPRNSRNRRRGSYGNWPRRGTQWVQYDWSQPISTRSVEVYWWDDRRGVRLPRACRLLWWDGKAFVPVKDPVGLGVVANQYNRTTFDEVRTSRLRLEIDSAGRFSTGILEWKVFDSGNSPDFPPKVTAGIDRIVMLGGKTYLSGATKTLEKYSDTSTKATSTKATSTKVNSTKVTATKVSSTKVTWSKVSGPGSVAFADANALKTTATFSAAGTYVLGLTVSEGSLSGASRLRVKVVPRPPTGHLDPIDTKNYKIDSPLWNSRAKALIVNWIPHCIRKISDPDLREGGIQNFVEAASKLAGKPHRRHRGYVFSNAWVYNTIESICVALMIDPRGDREMVRAQKSMKKTLGEWIPKILAAQEPDGYLQTAFTLSDRERWSPRHRGDHEGYVAGYFLEAAIAHYLFTGKSDARLYEAARKLADCWDAHIGPSPKKQWFDGHQALELALVRFGRLVNSVEGEGRGDKYVKLARFLLDCRKGGHAYDQSHRPVIEQYEAVGHAVRAVYSYAGMADIAMRTGDVDYQSAVASLWDNIVNKKYYVTGGVGSGESSEGFGPNYSLRHNAYCESCSSCGEIFFQHRLNLTYHDSRYADLYEETLYNALLGSIDLAGDNFYYQNPLDARRSRYPWHNCPCCVGNIPRTLLMLPSWMYAKSADSVHVNLFIGSTVTIKNVASTDVEIVQVTDHPWSGDVSITINPKAETRFSVKIRVPNRGVSDLYTPAPSSDGITSIAVNGSAIQPAIRQGYAEITRRWKTGDKIDLVLPMRVQRVKASDKIAATRGRVALRRGPLIYCVESVDQDLNKVLDPASVLKTEWRGDLLGGVIVIKSRWTDGSPLLAIPYYARNNRRRDTRSSVWLKAGNE